MIRISGGEFKGKAIKIPKTVLTRPSTSYSKKVIFDTLMGQMFDAIVLDLFAGSGALGIEALSRGANGAIFNDLGKAQNSIIKENLASLGLLSKSTLIQQDAIKTLKEWSHEKIDVLFLDPPYSMNINQICEILTLIEQKQILQPGGAICLEIHSSNLEMIKKLPFSSLKITKEKKKGSTTLLFIR